MVGEHNLRFLFLLQGAFFFLPQITPKKNPKNVKKVEENFTSAALVDPCKSRIPMDAFFLGDKKSGCDKIRWTLFFMFSRKGGPRMALKCPEVGNLLEFIKVKPSKMQVVHCLQNAL